MSKEELIKADQNARDLIKDDVKTNYFVEAGAGSGKTTSLVKRMVTMVKSGFDVSKICAITFTKAAANEFYSRFQEALAKEAPADDKCAEALKNIDLCFMGTIDSFCQMILSEHPAEAGIPSSSEIISDDEKESLYHREYSRIQNGIYGKVLQDKCAAFRACYWNHTEIFIALLKLMLDNRNAEIMTDPAGVPDIEKMLDEAEAELKGMFLNIIANGGVVYDKNAPSRQAYEDLCSAKHVISGTWSEDISNVISVLKKTENLRLFPGTDLDSLGMGADGYFTGHDNNGKIKWYYVDTESGSNILNKLNKAQAAIAIDFVKESMPVIAENLKKEGKLVFFDYLLYLRDMLKKDAEGGHKLINHIYSRHSYFLIDEFQDTNPMQAEVFFYLAAQNPQSDWRKCVPYPGSLFIVGDPKQSIYRFRSADVGAFARVRELFTGEVGEVLNLSCNFRSTHRMNTWFNSVFSEMLPENTDNQSAFSEIPLEDEPEEDGTFKGVYYYDSQSGKNADPNEADQVKVGDIIERLVGNPDYKIREYENKEEAPIREIEYKDFMLITPSKTKLADYMRELTARNIPFRIEGKVVFNECPALVMAAKIFAALAHPGEKLYRIGLNDLDILSDAGIKTKDMSCVSLLGLIMDRFRIFEKCGTDNMETLYFAMELLRDGQVSGEITSLIDGAEFLAKLLANESDEERSISLQKDDNKVHIANLHKVKGLEAPIVILAAPGGTTRTPNVRVENTGDAPKCWIFAASKNNITLFQNGGFEEERESEKDALAAETLRLLYVAATRARRVLLVGRSLSSKGEDNHIYWSAFSQKADGNFFSLPEGHPQASNEKNVTSAGELKGEESDNVFAGSTSAEKSYEILRPSQIKVKGKTEDSDFDDADDAQASTKIVRKNAALIGTMVHKMMESVVSAGRSGALADIDAGISEEIQKYMENLSEEIISEYGYTETDGKNMLVNVGKTILTSGFSQSNGVIQDIFKELMAADEVFCELPFCYQMPDESEANDITSDKVLDETDKTSNISSKTIWNGVMDAVYKKDGKWHIIDYKTNADADDLDKKYQAQLSAYIAAFKAMTGEDADAMIYHLDV